MKENEMIVPLSKRLLAIVSFVTPGNRAADIGCDHGFVPIDLVKQKIVPKAIAMDIKKGPLQRAAEHIQEYGLEQMIETRLSDGMEQLHPGEVDTIILSGIGGPLMIQILEKGMHVTASLKEMVLSPQSEIEQVRRYLVAHSFCITEEKMVLEDGKYYVVMHVIVNKEKQFEWTDLEYRYGKSLLEKRDDVFLSYLQWEQETKMELWKRLDQTDTERAKERQKQLGQELQMNQEAQNLIQQ